MLDFETELAKLMAIAEMGPAVDQKTLITLMSEPDVKRALWSLEPGPVRTNALRRFAVITNESA